MRQFSIVDAIDGTAVAEFHAADSGDILNVIQRSGCRNADVFRDGEYFTSARLSENEVWSLYRRRGSGPLMPLAIIPMAQKGA